jgi:hypothetical protein
MDYPLEALDTALRDAIFEYANTGVTDSEPIIVPAQVMFDLEPLLPADETDALIASAGCDWPVTIASWASPL